jgi:hypothetical protein
MRSTFLMSTRRFRNPASICLALLSLALLALGCGGSSDSNAGSNENQDAQAAFIKRANAICKEGSADFSTKAKVAFQQSASKSELATNRKLVHIVVAPEFEQEIREIRDLGPSPSGGHEVEAILSSMQRLVDELKANPLSGGRYPYREVEDLAAGYGLSECGHP